MPKGQREKVDIKKSKQNKKPFKSQALSEPKIRMTTGLESFSLFPFL